MGTSISQGNLARLSSRSALEKLEFSVQEIYGIEALRSYESMLDDLCTKTIEPNPFYEPWMLLPALESYAGDAETIFLLVMAKDLRDGNRSLVGFFPLEVRPRCRGLPFRHVALWQHAHCFLATPLLHAKFVGQSLQAFMAWFQTECRFSLLELNRVSGEGVFYREYKSILDNQAWKVLEQRYERALFRPAADAEAYARMSMSTKSSKEYRRLFRRLSSHGDLCWDTLSPAAPINAWIDDFLSLEGSGWKGRSGTALRQSTAGDAFFRKIASEAFKRQRLLILALRLDRRPIAMIAVLLQEQGSFAFKLAYDENYRAWAPGVLLLIELNRVLHGQEKLAWMDSCAAPDHALANRLWLQRRSLSNILVAKRLSPGAGVLRILPVLTRIKHRAIRLSGKA